MAKSYTGSAAAYQFDPTNASPIDVRTVVNSYLSLFDTETWNVNGTAALYNGLPVFVCQANNNSAALNEKSGLYILTRKNALNSGAIVNCWEYLYDPDATEIQEPTGSGENFVPGKTNLGGWLKILSFPDLKFPAPDPDETKEYVLKIYPDGTFNWEESTGGNGIPDPSDTENPTYLTATWNSATQKFDITWTTVSQDGGNIPDPSEPDTVLTAVPDGQGGYTLTWTNKNDSTGIKIKGYPMPPDQQPDEDGRWHPVPAAPPVNKTTLSNSGEVIAVPVDSEEDQSDDDTDPDRPFKLMLNYDEIPPLTINGGSSEPDDVTYIFTEEFWVSGNIDPDFTLRKYILHGNPIPQERQQGSTVYDSTTGTYYTVSSRYYPSTYPSGSMTEDITIRYYVTVLPAWEPVVKYALMRATNGNIGEFPEFDVTDAGEGEFVLSNTAPNGTDSAPAQSPYKYFYLIAPVYSADMFTQYGLAGILKLSDAQIAGADYWATGTSSEWRSFPQNSHLTFSYTALSGRNGEYRLSMETDGNASDIIPIRFKVQQ